jgi:hypothetical protein
MSFLSKIGGAISGLLGVLLKPIGKLLQKWLAPDVRGKEALTIQREGSNISIPVLYGRRKIGGIIVDRNVTDVAGGAKNEFFHMMVVFCHGEVESVDDILFNGKSSTDPDYAKSGGGYWHNIEIRLGGTDNNTAVNAAGKLNNFSASTSKYEGLCIAFITLQLDKDQKIWRGEPSVTAIIKGKKCYDWRTATTAYTENGALHTADYLKSPIYGKGLSDADINYPYFTVVANSCDVQEATSTETRINSFYDRELDIYINSAPITVSVISKRFTNNAIVDTEREIFDNLQEITNSFRGYFPEPDGRIAIASEDVAASVFDFDADNIVGSISRTTASRNDRYNRVVVRFPNIENQYKFDEVFYPAADSQQYIDWLAEDNGMPLQHVITADWCVYKAESLQLAEVGAKISRNSDSVQFTATLEAMELDVGDVVSISDENRGWTAVKFRVASLNYRDDLLVDITAILYNATVFPWAAKAYDQVVGGIFLGDPNNITAPTGLVFTPDGNLSNSGLLTWSHTENYFIKSYKVDVISSNGDVVLSSTETNKSYSVPLLLPDTYTLNIYAVSTLGLISAAAVVVVVLQGSPAPTDLTLIVGDWQIEVQPVVVGTIGAGTTFEFDFIQGGGAGHVPAVRASGSSFTITGLIPSTLYTAFARTTNAYGQSSWFAKSTTTTQVGASVDLFIGPIIVDLAETQQQLDDYETQANAAFSTIQTDIQAIDSEASNLEYRIQISDANSDASELALLQAVTKDASSREDLRLRLARDAVLIDAAIEVDPITGTITNRAFSYTDDSFNQAVLLIDGVEAQISAVVERIDLNGGDISTLTSELLLVPAQITATATAIVSESIAALQPVYAFNFFDSAQGWSAVNGALTEGTNKVAVTWGDIQNTSLSYAAADNKFIRAAIERTGGAGWDGSVVITRDDASTQTFLNYIPEPAGALFILLIDFTPLAAYSGTITGVRLILGTSVADTFDVTSISIGKADASTQDLQNITARVSQAEIDIDANNGAITQRVTVTDYNNNTVTFSNAAATIDGLNSIIALEANRQLLVNNGTVVKANEAAVTIDGYAGTITALAQTVTDNQDSNIIAFQQASVEIDSASGRITDNVFGLVTSRNQSEDEGLVALLAEIDIANIKKNDTDRDVIFADAVSQLAIDVSPAGAIAESIANLTAVVNTNGVSLLANANTITQVKADIEGSASAISQLELDVTALDNETSAALVRIDAVEVDAGNNTTAIASVDLRVDNTDSNVTAAVTRIDAVEIVAGGNTTAINAVDIRINSADSNVTAAVTRISAVEIVAGDNTTAINTVDLRVDNTDSNVTAAVTRIDAVEIEAGDNATAIASVDLRVDNTDSNVTAAVTRISAVEIVAGDNTSSLASLQSTVSGVGSTANSALTLSTTLNNSLSDYRATAQLSVDASGNLGFIKLDATPTNNTIKIKTDQTQFLDDNGDVFIEFDSPTQTATFLGTIFAENIDGDVTDAIIKTTTRRNWDGTGDPSRIAEVTRVTVAAMPFARFITCSRILYNKIGIQRPVMRFSGIASKTVQTLWYSAATTQRYALTLTPCIAIIPANTSGDVVISVGESNNTDQYYECPAQEIIISTFKQGSSLS